jgi:hypothetical protein
MNTTVVLPSPNSPSKPLPLTLSGYPKEVGGFPAFYARKEILKCGDYVHPSTGLKFSITPQRIDGLVQSFKKMQERGHKVFLPGKHRDYDAKDNFGWAIAMERQGDSLYAVEQLIGEDAKLTAARNDRSVLIRPNFKDEQGNEYPEAIEHVALCPDPVISGMSGTVPIAASKSSPAVEALVLELDCGTGAGGFKGGNTCAAGGGSERDKRKSPEHHADTGEETFGEAPEGVSQEDWETAVSNRLHDMERRVYGHDPAGHETSFNEKLRTQKRVLRENPELLQHYIKSDSPPPESLMPARMNKPDSKSPKQRRSAAFSRSIPMTEAELTAIGELIGTDGLTDETAVPRLIDWGKQVKPKSEALSRTEKDRDDWKKKAEDSTLALSRATPAKPTAKELWMSARLFRDMKERAVASGAIDQPRADRIEKRFLGAADTNALTLSRAPADSDVELSRGLDQAIEFFELIQGNTPGPKPGEQTAGQQLLELQRKAAGGEDDSAKARQDGQKEAEAYQKQQLQARGLATA